MFFFQYFNDKNNKTRKKQLKKKNAATGDPMMTEYQLFYSPFPHLFSFSFYILLYFFVRASSAFLLPFSSFFFPLPLLLLYMFHICSLRPLRLPSDLSAMLLMCRNLPLTRYSMYSPFFSLDSLPLSFPPSLHSTSCHPPPHSPFRLSLTMISGMNLTTA